MPFYVYIMANRPNGTLYVGATRDLVRRVWQHKEGHVSSFTRQNAIKRLVYYEQYEDVSHAVQREKSLKRYRRDWKINLIEKDNRFWEDLYPKIV